MIRNRRLAARKAAAASTTPSKSIYERVTGKKNPAWADKAFNEKQFPSIAERMAPKLKKVGSYLRERAMKKLK